jgi:MFS family permease
LTPNEPGRKDIQGGEAAVKQRLAIVAVLGSTQTLAWASSYYLPAVLAAPMGRDIGLSTPWIYATLSLGLGVSAVLAPALGRRIDEHGGRSVLCGSNVAFAAGLCALALASGPLTLIFAWLVLGVAMAAGLYESAFASLTRLYGYDSRGSITGITLIAGFASTVGWPISAFLEHSIGWRGACLSWAALHILVGLPLNAWALRHGNRDGRHEPTHEPTVAVGRAPSPPAASDHSMLILAFMFTASGMVSIGMATNLPRLFAAMGAAPAAAIAAASMLGPAQVAARVLEFSARHRINPLISARVANVLHPLASLAIAVGGTPVIAVFSILHGAGTGMLTITRGTLPLALYGPAGYGARMGRIAAPARIGQALSPFLAGLAIEKLGVRTLIMSSSLSLAALIALSWVALPASAATKAN